MIQAGLTAMALALSVVWPTTAPGCAAPFWPNAEWARSADAVVVADVVGQSLLGESENWWDQNLDLQIIELVHGDLRGQDEDARVTVTSARKKMEGEAHPPSYLEGPYLIVLVWSEDPDELRARGEFEFWFDVRLPVYNTFAVLAPSSNCGSFSSIFPLDTGSDFDWGRRILDDLHPALPESVQSPRQNQAGQEMRH